VAEANREQRAQRLHEAAWPDMFKNLQSAYAELAQAQFELLGRTADMEEARDLFERVVASMSEALFLLDPTGRVVRTNPAAAALFERDERSLVGQAFVAICGRSDVPATPWQLVQRAPAGALRDVEVEIRTGTGRARTLSASCGLVRDGRGKIIGMLVIARDVTERRRAEAERAELLERERKARTVAEEANRAKDEFLAMLSHELRTPLNAMFGWMRLVRSGTLDASTHARALETIERNMRMQTQLIEDLLDVSRIITGKLRLEVRPVDLVPVIESALEVVRPAATAKAIELQVVLEPLVDPVAGDPDRLRQVVWNLASNAIKFTPPQGRVTVRLERAGAEAQITVRDTGQGIGPEFLPFVFERFRQADSSSTRAYGGLGLGLAIVRHLMELHGGTVAATSEGEGRGAEFKVRLPFMAARGQSGFRGRLPTVAASGPWDAGVSLAGLRVLLVEDGLDERQLLSTVLEQRGAEVIAVSSAEAAWRVFDEIRPHVLVSDIAMPQVDGYTLVRKVRSLPAERGGATPAVAVTAFASDEERQRALEAGFHIHLAKPVEPAELVTTIQRLCRPGAP
jgi:PAS domain S-box-containing protein